MLAQPLTIEDIPRKAEGYWMEPKLDGIRCITYYDTTHREWVMTSRSAKTSLAEKVPHIAKELDSWPHDIVLDGELGYEDKECWVGAATCWPILDFNKTVRVTGSSTDVALTKQDQNDGYIGYFVFDLLDVHEALPTQRKRRDLLLYHLTTEVPQYIYRVDRSRTWIEDVYNTYILDGGEGVMLKNPASVYQPDKRPARTWYKIKKFDTFDGTIVDIEWGQGKYTDLIGALVVWHPDGFRVRCSGMTDEQRQHMTDYYTRDYLQKHVEVKFFGKVGQDGTGIRHPQYLRMRPDLDA